MEQGSYKPLGFSNPGRREREGIKLLVRESPSPSLQAPSPARQRGTFTPAVSDHMAYEHGALPGGQS